jgi:hypothetical protein
MSVNNLNQSVNITFKKTFGTTEVGFSYGYKTGNPPTMINCSVREVNEDKTEDVYSASFYKEGVCNMNSPKRNHTLVWADIYSELAAYVDGLFTAGYENPE